MSSQGRVLALVLLVGLTDPCFGQPLPPLAQSVRSLSMLQDKIALGDAEAERLEGGLLIQIETDVRLAKPEDLIKEASLDAVAMALFSGANPNPIEQRLARLPIKGERKDLILGALAYARGEKDRAEKYLKNLPLHDFPTYVAGRLALVRGIIAMSEDHERALSELRQARLLMPGSLIEESALRRCLMLTTAAVRAEEFRFCTYRYIRDFSHSLYWPDFVETYAASLAQSSFGEKPEDLEQMLSAINQLDTEKRLMLLLALSETAVRHGRPAIAGDLAAVAEPLCSPKGPEHLRAMLYSAAARLVTGDVGAATSALKGLQGSPFKSADQQLYADALALSSAITQDPKLTVDAAKALSASLGSAADDSEEKAVFNQVHKAMEAAVALESR